LPKATSLARKGKHRSATCDKAGRRSVPFYLSAGSVSTVCTVGQKGNADTFSFFVVFFHDLW